MDYYFNDYKFQHKINYIYHISDIHINLQAKHDEYRSVFRNLYKFLKKDKIDNDAVIVITGDILHSKTELLPECIELTRDFLTKLSNVMPVIFIAGNHDMNINNENRLDALTPIYNGIPKDKPVYYLEKSGVHKFNNIFFCVTSIRDYIILDPTKIHNPNKCTLIALYHGRVNGAELFNNMKIEGELNKKTNKTITVSCFDGYDYGLFGDIHKHQYLNSKKTIAYAGSLIQQNHGESLDNHGVLKWNLVNKTSTYHSIQNDFGYITLLINNSNINDLQLIKNNKQKIPYHYEDTPKNLHLRLHLNNTPNSIVQEIISKLKEKHKIIEVAYQDISEEKENKYDNLLAENITQATYQNKLIEEFLSEKTDCSKNMIETIKQLNIASNDTLDKTSYSNTGHWKLIKLEFSNLYSYGDNNIIEFDKFNGIVGIIAQNHMGKSALIDIILYTLFDKFPRKGTLKDIINNRKTNFFSRLTFQIEDWNYIIEKTGFLTNTNRTNTKSNFYRLHKDNNKIKEYLHEDSMIKTKNSILQYIGNYDDIIQTNISLQHNNCIFIDSENTKRKKELERILKVDFIDELIKRSSSNLLEKKAVLKHLEKKCPIDHIRDTKSQIKLLIGIITSMDKEIKDTKDTIDKKEQAIKEITSTIIPNIDQTIENLKKQYNSIESININELEDKIKDTNNLIDTTKEKIASFDTSLLDKEKLQTIYNLKVKEDQSFCIQKEIDISNLDLELEKLYKQLEVIEPNYTDKKTINTIFSEYKELKKQANILLDRINFIKVSINNNYETEIKQVLQELENINKNEIPNAMKDYFESIPILDIEDELDNYKQNANSSINELLETHKQYSIFNYLSNYEDEFIKKLNEKPNLIRQLKELEKEQETIKILKDEYYEKKEEYSNVKENLYAKKLFIQKVKEMRVKKENNNNITIEIDKVKEQKTLTIKKENQD